MSAQKQIVALVTGANRGLGLALAKALVARGAKVYAAARDPRSIDVAAIREAARGLDDGQRATGDVAVRPSDTGGIGEVIPVRLDVTNADDIAAVARAARDVTLLVNNAGISRGATLFGDDAVAAAHAELDTNVFGPLALSRVFAPTLAANGGGAIVNVLSVLSWVTLPTSQTYSLSKAAAWSMTNGLRGSLAGQGTHVMGVHVGYMDTDMAKHVDGPKTSPDEVARRVLDGLAAGAQEVLADDISQHVKAGLSAVQASYLGLAR